MRRLLLTAWALIVCAVAACPVDFAALKPEGYVSDFARVIDSGSRAGLERYCARLEAQTGAQVAVVTLGTLAGEPVEDVANDMFRRWGVGQKGKNEGLLLLLVTQDHKMRLEVGYGLEPVIPDGFAGSILRAMRPALREGRYGAALTEAVHVAGSRIAEAKGVKLDTALPHRTRPRAPDIPWPVIAGGIAMLLLLLKGAGGGRRRGHGSGADLLLAMLAGNMMGRSMGGRSSGGGFGGWDSGDTFGGFGGGDSGGGGASSSW
jgi:uncharacterized protein